MVPMVRGEAALVAEGRPGLPGRLSQELLQTTTWLILFFSNKLNKENNSIETLQCVVCVCMCVCA